MEATYIYIGVYGGLPCRAYYESFCAVGAIPHAGMADGPVICSIWNTNSDNEHASAKVVPNSIGVRSGCMFGVELV